VYIWENAGFIMTIMYAGLQMIPRDILEAASVDGATPSQRVRYITIPMLRDTLGICTVLVITGAFRIFELVFMLTGGGPVHTSDVLVTYMYYLTFTSFEYGPGMAIAVVTSGVSVIVFGTYLVVSQRRSRETS